MNKVKEFFAAFFRYPGFGLYVGIGKTIKPKFQADRNGFVIMFFGLYIVGSYYDFIEASGRVMQEVNELRKENAMMQQMYSGRTQRRIR
jgi:hypothetical protein